MGKVDALIKELNAAWRMEVAVVVVDSLPAEIRPSAFAAALLNYWGVGDPKVHTGVVALLMIKQRRLEVRVGFGTQRVLKQEFLQKLQQERMVPHLKSGASRTEAWTSRTSTASVAGRRPWTSSRPRREGQNPQGHRVVDPRVQHLRERKLVFSCRDAS